MVCNSEYKPLQNQGEIKGLIASGDTIMVNTISMTFTLVMNICFKFSKDNKFMNS